MSASTTTAAIPRINLLCIVKAYSEAFHNAARNFSLPPHIASLVTIHQGLFQDLTPDLKFDLIVSPANSYGILDGGFDDAISRTLSPADDYFTLTRVARQHLYDVYRGFLPPGACSLVEIPAEFGSRTENKRKSDGGWGCRYVALCPTMRVPGSAKWDREVAYECVWTLLCKIDQHNRAVAASVDEQGKDAFVNSILMTPLGTGTGGISAEKWAAQLVVALKHFDEAVRDQPKWSHLEWREAKALASEVQDTHSL